MADAMWTWHRRMAADGAWDVVLNKLTAAAGATGLVDWSIRRLLEGISTPSTLPASQGAGSSCTNLTDEPPDHAVGRSCGGLSIKIHELVDGQGLPLVVLLAVGRAGNSPVLFAMMEQLRIAVPSDPP